jgi:hypothetical protein
MAVRKEKQARSQHWAEVNRLKGKRAGASLKEEVWLTDGVVTDYNLVYVNRNRCQVDHGRVLGYDNSHGFHHRHFMGAVEASDFHGYDALADRFYAEVHKLWRQEDEED